MVAFYYRKSDNSFRVNDDVAVMRLLPWGRELISITKIKWVGDLLIETLDCRLFSAADGQSVGGRQTCYLEALKPAHLRTNG